MKNNPMLQRLVVGFVIVFVAIFAGVQYKNGAFSTQQRATSPTTVQKAKRSDSTATQQSPKNATTVTKDKDATGNTSLQKMTNAKTDALGNEDFSTMERPSVDEIKHAQQHVDQVASQFVGSVEVPKIGLKLHVLEGCTYEKMLYGATTLMPNQVMGEGNYALASHNMGVEGSMFTSIHQLQLGDDIFLTNQAGQRFHYHVTKNEVVDFRDTHCLEEQDQPTVTLVTCQSVQTTPNRVIVQGVLVK